MGESREAPPVPSQSAKDNLQTYRGKQRHHVARGGTVEWPSSRAYLLFIKPSRITAWCSVYCQTKTNHLLKTCIVVN